MHEDAAQVAPRELRKPRVARLVEKSGVPSFHSDWWVCIPEPLSPKIGFGMKVALLPAALATLRTTYL